MVKTPLWLVKKVSDTIFPYIERRDRKMSPCAKGFRLWLHYLLNDGEEEEEKWRQEILAETKQCETCKLFLGWIVRWGEKALSV